MRARESDSYLLTQPVETNATSPAVEIKATNLEIVLVVEFIPFFSKCFPSRLLPARFRCGRQVQAPISGRRRRVSRQAWMPTKLAAATMVAFFHRRVHCQALPRHRWASA